MKHRLEPKKGARNKQAELLEEWEECTCSDCPDVPPARGCPIHDKETVDNS